MKNAIALLARSRSESPAFVQWWIGELLSFVPDTVRSRIRRRRTLITIDLDGEAIFVGQLGSGRYRQLARVAIVDVANGHSAEALRGIVAPMVRLGAKVAVRLRTDQALRKTIEFPSSAERDLRRILGLELDLQTPAIAADSLFDYRIVERDSKRKQLLVELAVVRRETVARVLTALAPLGLEASQVGLSNGEDLQFNFVETSRLKAYRLNNRFAVASLALFCAVLLGIATDLQNKRNSQATTALTLEVAMQKAVAAKIEQLKNDFATKSREYSFLPNRKRAPLAAIVLNEIARILPDDTWLSQIDLVGQRVHMVGFSAASSQLISLVDQSSFFANARFQSPVTQVGGRSLEHFELTFDVKQGANER